MLQIKTPTGRAHHGWFALRTDNRTIFVDTELKDLRNIFLSENHRNQVHAYCLNNGIDWCFIPPRSQHIGGLWEANVKMAKRHFYNSVVCKIFRKPRILYVLTPGHFLIGGFFIAIYKLNLTYLNCNRLDRWQQVTYIQQILEVMEWIISHYSTISSEVAYTTPKYWSQWRRMQQ